MIISHLKENMKMKTLLCKKPLAFITGKDNIEGRFDVNYYKPKYREIITRLENSPFEIKRLCDIISLSNERWKRPESGSFNYIEINDIDTFSAQIIQAKEFNVEDAPSRAQMVIRENDIIVSTTRPYRGAIALVTKKFDAHICSTGFTIIRDIKTEINRKYLLYFLHSNLGLKQMEQRMTGGNYPAILPEELLNIYILLPPLQLQDKIIQIIDDAMKEMEEMESESEVLFRSIDDYILQELGITLPEFEKMSPFIYEVGVNFLENDRWDVEYWKPDYRKTEKSIEEGKYKVKKLGQIIEEINYGASVKNIYSEEEGIPFLRIINLKPNKVDLSNLVKLPNDIKKELGNSYIHQGDFIISRSGTIGIVAIVPKEADGFAFGSYMIRFKIKDIEINKYYLSIVLNSSIGRRQTQRSKIGAIQNNITIPSIKSLVIPLPQKLIQDKIADEAKSRIERAKELKESAKKVFKDAKEKIEKIILGEIKDEGR